MFKVLEPDYADYDIKVGEWAKPKPFGISGCFRVRNDQEFMETSVESHIQYLDEAVLLVQPSSDDTVAIAYDLERRYPDKVRVEWYPVAPVWIDDPRFPNIPVNSIYSAVYMSNYALSKCRFSWIAKTEADVYCLSPFEQIVDLIHKNPDRYMYYGRVLLNLAGENFNQFSATNPRTWGMDEAVFPNTPDYHFVLHANKWESVNFFDRQAENNCMGWSGFHLKRNKKKYFKPDVMGEQYAPLDKETVDRVLSNYNATYHYPGKDDPLGLPEFYRKHNIKRNSLMV